MKKLLSILLVSALIALCCTGCGKDSSETTEPTETPGSGGLNQALESTGDSDSSSPSYVIEDEELTSEDETEPDESASAEMPAAEDALSDDAAMPAAEDAVTEEAPAEDTATDTETSESTESSETDNSSVIVSQSEVVPFATEAPQPNASITSFSACENTGLGFKFNYPTGWTNLPGRSTVCYIQPMTNGTVYPGRVSVTMKRLLHSCGTEELQDELKSYHANLKTQFSNLKVPDNLIDTETEFMGKKALSFNYVAYDGEQEIKGYVIMTHFERYVFVFHFLCAYGDYDSFYPSMIKMRDSVQVEQED